MKIVPETISLAFTIAVEGTVSLRDESGPGRLKLSPRAFKVRNILATPSSRSCVTIVSKF